MMPLSSLGTRRRAGGCVSLLGALLLALFSFGQTEGPQKPPPPVKEPQIRAEVDLVLVNVTVEDPYGRIVTGLEQENFRVFEDGVEQEIVHLSGEDVPVSIGLVLDLSGSMTEKMPIERTGAVEFLRGGNARDEFLVVAFRNRAELVSDFTSIPEELESRLLYLTSHGLTALYDGVYLALAKMSSAHNQRRAIILISDGGENHSRYSEKDITRFLLEADTQFYTIGVFGRPRTPEEAHGPELLRELTERTGGRSFAFSPDSLPDIVQKIGNELRSQYVLAYRPSNRAHDGHWRKIQVQLVPPRGLPPLHLYARTGYTAPSY